ncbi:flagellar hook-length control protein FliK [Pseudomonas japonica]|uniref:flagellar hook-length control protein FliK n=1 Tax=Pseudomonas japonica TaxID=256466 RepID=UPI0015E3E93B|nr:flagellar hook-length control protein FliK [Pseudomonas japonica]MBA1291076.1 flagellar hook-length control protein FliK [Pseudomonas japonica]
MAVASNPLLQIGTSVGSTGKVQANALSSVTKVADATKDGASSFAEVYAKEHQAVPQKAAANASARSSEHFAASDKKAAFTSKAKDDKPAVAADGKPSPAKADKADRSNKADKSAKADQANDTDSVKADEVSDEAKVADASADDQADETTDVVDATALPATPVADPTAAAPAVVPADPALAPQPVIDPAQLQAANQAQAPSADDAFDPAADPLADLPMVRMALEHTAKAQGTTSVHAQAENTAAQQTADTASGDTFAQGMGAMLEQQKATDGLGVGKEGEDGIGAIGDIKDGTAGTSGRVEDLTSRLNQLNQAVGGKAATTATPPAQPLNMQQNGWSEGLVNRVMYLSSQNLKSADIQLHPLELGRLDIRVDVTADQTQITFHSAHVGVRDALESQQGRLRDMLSQQGLTQVDVNVSDQSRQQQQQQQQTHAQAGQGTRSGSGRSGGVEGDMEVSAVAEAAAAQSVVGSSLVDYYA